MKVTRSYVFGEKDIPFQSEYLQVRYSPEFPALPADLAGETFSHVFGTNSSALEMFILDRRIKGPCWLDITSPQVFSFFYIIYGDGTGNTVEENSSVFSLIRMC